MNAKSRKNLFVAIAVSLTVVSCSLGGKDYAMTSDESIAKVKELVKPQCRYRNEQGISHRMD